MPTGETRFVPLAQLMRLKPAATLAAAPSPDFAAVLPVEDAAQPPLSGPSRVPEMGAEPGTSPDGAGPDGRRESARAIREARLFRAALADTFDAIVADLVRRLAAEVVSRELRLAPVDVEGLTRRLIAEQQADEPVSLRVSPADAHISCELPLVADASLQPGDAVLICRSGEVDARLAVRLANVLNAVTW